MKPAPCCATKPKSNKGILSGFIFGLIPHFFCFGFILFSVIGAFAATAFFKKFLLIPNLFYVLLFISLTLATVSALIYLKKSPEYFIPAIKRKWKYLATLYSTTLLVNLLLFFVVFPVLANINFQKISQAESAASELSINVQIPCTGHAPLIIDEIKKNCEIESITFSAPDKFDIKYNPNITTPEKIASLEIFKTYPLKNN